MKLRVAADCMISELSDGKASRRPPRLWWLHRAMASILFFFTMIGGVESAPGLDPAKQIDQYGHDVWTSQSGLIGEAVYQVLQSPDGYLWLRTSAGLVRFDGVRFVRVEPVVAGRAINEPVKAICLGTGGDLLVRSVSRTLIYRNGAFSDYRPPAPLP